MRKVLLGLMASGLFGAAVGVAEFVAGSGAEVVSSEQSGAQQGLLSGRFGRRGNRASRQ